MQVKENKESFPPYLYYTDVEEKFTKFTPECRVLPARYYYEHNLVFILKKRYEPGEHKYFPKGGFEVLDTDGGVYNFYLDEVIVHPYHLGMTRYFSQAKNNKNKEKVNTGVKGKRGRPKMDPTLKKIKTEYIPTGRKRGRLPLDPAVKAAREAEKLANKKPTSGKRGRPKKIQE